ncbi:hypothetical protein ACT80S_07685 [Ramlibacter sp. MAHUQ-53]|uniref:hypothetical protein n=1 Tax=unclassified Ramlibacter TaxID=2617605 RepID=UPI003628D91F
MNRLQAELRRLYLVDDPAAPAGSVRAMVLELGGPEAWSGLAPVWQGVQADLELPAPAIAVTGGEGLQLWFSLAAPVDAGRAAAFLEGLRRRFLAGQPASRVRAAPSPGASALPDFPPQPVAADRWSAFVARDLAPLFDDEPWLDQPAGPDAQADLLSRLEPIPLRGFEQALARLGQAPAAAAPGAAAGLAGPATATATACEGETLAPRAFLRRVMNDPAVEMALRIEAAKALLPHLDG